MRDRGAYQKAEVLFDTVAQIERETTGKPSAYLTGQIALLRLAQKRYGEAQQMFDRYLAYFDDGKPSESPQHIPIIKGYEWLQHHTDQAKSTKAE
ncbi:MAG: hypothetical protein ABGY96_04045 [bacterium]|nr:hypothetical protein [Gammaproteobacteria bacterium]